MIADFGCKNATKKILLGWERAREHMMATQKHNPIYFEWCIKFGALGGGKYRKNRGHGGHKTAENEGGEPHRGASNDARYV